MSVLTMQSFDRYRVGPEAVLADEDHLPGLCEERPAVVGEERQQDDVHHQLHHEQPPEHRR